MLWSFQITFKFEYAPVAFWILFLKATVEINMDKLCVKFLALNVDFDIPSLDFLGSRRPAHKGITEPQIQWVSRWHCALYKLNLLTYLLTYIPP